MLQGEVLGPRHDILLAAFSSGVDALDLYLKNQASQDARKRMAVPYVLISSEGKIAGYYTLSAYSIPIDGLPVDFVKRLRLPRYDSLPTTLIGRLARDLSFRGKGIGELLLLDAAKVALRASEAIGSLALVVDAKDDHARKFYLSFGFLALPETQRRLFLPMRTVENLLRGSVR